jgi:hypothetical protein
LLLEFKFFHFIYFLLFHAFFLSCFWISIYFTILLYWVSNYALSHYHLFICWQSNNRFPWLKVQHILVLLCLPALARTTEAISLVMMLLMHILFLITGVSQSQCFLYVLTYLFSLLFISFIYPSFGRERFAYVCQIHFVKCSSSFLTCPLLSLAHFHRFVLNGTEICTC